MSANVTATVEALRRRTTVYAIPAGHNNRLRGCITPVPIAYHPRRSHITGTFDLLPYPASLASGQLLPCTLGPPCYSVHHAVRKLPWPRNKPNRPRPVNHPDSSTVCEPHCRSGGNPPVPTTWTQY